MPTKSVQSSGQLPSPPGGLDVHYPSSCSNSQQLLNLIQWSWMDPWLSLRVIAQLNALPLAVQITNIVGGVTVGWF